MRKIQSSSTFKMTEIGPLPENWEMVKFDKAVKTRGVKVGKVKQSEYRLKGKYPIVDQGQNLISGYWDNEEDVYKGKLPVIIFGDHTRIFKFIDFPFVCGADGTKVLIPNLEYYDPRFLFYCFLTLKIPNRGYNRHFSLLREKYIPLPPRPEQKAIARVLKAIQDAIEATERVIAAAKELKKSLMRHLFTYGPVPVSEKDNVRLKQTEIGPIPEDWEVVRLGDYFKVQSGGTPSRKVKEYWENGSIPWITSSQCQDCIINQADQFITEAGLKNSSAKLVGPNVVLVAMVGATVGKTGFLTFKATTNQNVAAVWPKENIEANNWFMFYNLQTRYQEFKKREKFSIANLTFIRNLKVVLPPLPIQQKIAQILKAVDDKIEAEEKKKEALQVFFKTMLHHLMTGKIRVKYK